MILAALSLRVPLLFIVLVASGWAAVSTSRRFSRISDGLVGLPPFGPATRRQYAIVFATPVAVALAYAYGSWALFDLLPLFDVNRQPCCCCFLHVVELIAMFVVLLLFLALVAMWWQSIRPAIRPVIRRSNASASVRRTARTVLATTPLLVAVIWGSGTIRAWTIGDGPLGCHLAPFDAERWAHGSARDRLMMSGDVIRMAKRYGYAETYRRLHGELPARESGTISFGIGVFPGLERGVLIRFDARGAFVDWAAATTAELITAVTTR